jgi:trk system potassium uptake protein
MNPHIILRVIGLLLCFLALAMFPALIVAIAQGDGGVRAFVTSIIITAFAGALTYFLAHEEGEWQLSHRDGVTIVSVGWAAAGFFGALPFWFDGSFHSFTDAYFESLSGFTTTGASVLTEIESVHKGILLWRSIIQWLGGMGIIVLSIAILPFLRVGGMQLYKAEVPSPVVDKLKPRIAETASILWKIYVAFTALEIVLLLFGGMSLYDAVCHSFCTLPTGGFSPKNTSVGYYNSAYIDIVIAACMMLAGINFSLHYRLFKGNRKIYLLDSECRFFLIITGVFILIVTLDIYGSIYEGIGEALRYASFQVSSIITTTGFATADYEKWPALSQSILLTCMFIGASAGSTGGGIKCMRLWLLIKHSYNELIRTIHPHAVMRIKLGGNPVPDEVIHSVWGFFILYMGLFLIASLIMMALGTDMTTSFASVAATMGNIGPGLGMVGPADNYALIHPAGKWILSMCMLLGRLEIYTVMVMLLPEFWRS